MSRTQRYKTWLRGSGWGCLSLLLAFAIENGCGQTVQVGLDDALSTGGTAAAAGSGGGGTLQLGGTGAGGNPVAGSLNQAGEATCQKTLCRGKEYQCGNCVDDDGDGLLDALDPDCLGPCDNDEVGLSTGLTTPQSAACRQDCYFDGDNGPGNDKCEWSHACDPVSVAPNYPPSGEKRCKYDPSGTTMGVDCANLQAAQSQTCLDACLPLVPNGCDCFGCCELPGGSGNYHFVGGGTGTQGCQRDTLDDPTTCPPCTPVPSCFNDCAKCEVCVDKAPDPSCNPSSACPSSERECSPTAPCDFGDYCVTGCCVRAPEPI